MDATWRGVTNTQQKLQYLCSPAHEFVLPKPAPETLTKHIDKALAILYPSRTCKNGLINIVYFLARTAWISRLFERRDRLTDPEPGCFTFLHVSSEIHSL